MWRHARWFVVASVGCLTMLGSPREARAQGSFPDIVVQPTVTFNNYYGKQSWLDKVLDSAIRNSGNIVGDYMVKRAEASLIQQEVISKQLDNRRKALVQWHWERETLPVIVAEMRQEARV